MVNSSSSQDNSHGQDVPSPHHSNRSTNVNDTTRLGHRKPLRDDATSRALASAKKQPVSRFRLLADLTDAEEDGLAPPFNRMLAFEYLFFVLYTLLILGTHAYYIARSCQAHYSQLRSLLGHPLWVFQQLGAVGFDVLPDVQLRGYFSQLPVFCALAILSSGGTWCIRRLQNEREGNRGEGKEKGDAGAVENGYRESYTSGGRTRRGHLAAWVRSLLSQRWSLAAFHAVVGLGFIIVAHGPLFFFPLILSTVNFLLFKTIQRVRAPYWLFMCVMWILHVGGLYTLHVHAGFHDAEWSVYIIKRAFWSTKMRWFMAYRMYVLRMIAFNYDMWEANRHAQDAKARALAKHTKACVECALLRQQAGMLPRTQTAGSSTVVSPMTTKVEVDTTQEAGRVSREASEAARDESLWCYKLRTEYPRPTNEYTYLNYIAYLLYTPVYLTGPITSFNAFVSHMHVPTRVMPPRDMVRYGLRILFSGLCLLTLMHYVFVNALSNHTFVLLSLPVAEQTAVMYYYLAYLWLKFTIMWRCSRLFSLWCGVDVPENMRRCFSNTFSVRDFWRDWHASFNLWIVRYMYIPMGGRKRILFSIAPIFFFIAMWHDHALHLLKWAGCIVVLFALELLVSSTFGRLERSFSREMRHVQEGLTPARHLLAAESPGAAADLSESTKAMGNALGGVVTEASGERLKASSDHHQQQQRRQAPSALNPSAVLAHHEGSTQLRSSPSHTPVHGSSALRGKQSSGGWWHRLAKFAVTRLSRQQRRFAHRMLMTAGCSLVIFGLIVSNLIGYNIQNSHAFNVKDVGSHTDRNIARDLKTGSRLFLMVLLSTMWTPGVMSTVDRILAAAKLRQLKRELGIDSSL